MVTFVHIFTGHSPVTSPICNTVQSPRARVHVEPLRCLRAECRGHCSRPSRTALIAAPLPRYGRIVVESDRIFLESERIVVESDRIFLESGDSGERRKVEKVGPSCTAPIRAVWADCFAAVRRYAGPVSPATPFLPGGGLSRFGVGCVVCRTLFLQ